MSSVSLCYFRLMMLRPGLCWAAPSVLVAVQVHYEYIWDGSNAFLMAVLKDKTQTSEGSLPTPLYAASGNTAGDITAMPMMLS